MPTKTNKVSVDMDALRDALMTELVAEGLVAPQRTPTTKTKAGKPELQIDLSGIADLSEVRTRMADAMRTAIEEEYELMQQTQTQQLAVLVGQMTREKSMRELSQAVTAGSKEYPYGLPVKPERLFEFMKGLSADQYKTFVEMITSIAKRGAVDFSVAGSNGNGALKRELPAHIADSLRKGKLTVAQLSDPLFADDLGGVAISEFDLTAFQPVGKEA